MTPFDIVPVLDLKAGQVVHARAGERDRYLPIRSALAAGSEPRAILDGLLALAPFRCVYIADLDAIEGQGDHRDLIEDLLDRHRELDIWVDAGFSDADAAAEVADLGATPVLGSESWRDGDRLGSALARLGAARCVLSLDYRGDDFVGPPGFNTQVALWPERVIVMTLGRVGTGLGPDLARLDAVSRIASSRRVFAAGGVRGAQDIRALAERRLAGVLVATALHDGRLSREALAEFER
jgi:phosphoribosylformimino-5-aminoimidazole carboxamide ribotide isomerase